MKKEQVVDIYDNMTDEQKEAVADMIANSGNEEIKHSGMSAQDIFNSGKKMNSLKKAVLKHAGTYGINEIESLLPNEKLAKAPIFLNNEVEWVAKVMKAGTLPFARVKSMFVDIREESIRAKGYLKTGLKTEHVISHMKRVTSPQTIYTKQKMDRDDVIDITDFSIISWIKSVMKIKLTEEIARAILIGDGRTAESQDKIEEEHIRPIYNDDDLYTVKVAIPADATDKTTAFMDTIIRNRKLYKGAGSPSLFLTEDLISDMLLLRDNNGRRLYRTVSDIADELRVSELVPTTPMEGLIRDTADATKIHNVMAIMVNMSDYKLGSDNGGKTAMFDDFDIDYNMQKYLMETRLSGALITPFSAMVIEDIQPAPPAPVSIDETDEETLDLVKE